MTARVNAEQVAAVLFGPSTGDESGDRVRAAFTAMARLDGMTNDEIAAHVARSVAGIQAKNAARIATMVGDVK
jgi:hypothetical protein